MSENEKSEEKKDALKIFVASYTGHLGKAKDEVAAFSKDEAKKILKARRITLKKIHSIKENREAIETEAKAYKHEVSIYAKIGRL